jgi:F0F1-type ATP synthase membrane subunit c/vacuolar-type H+-ATPase subunit K
MNFIAPLLSGAARAADLPGDYVTSLLKSVAARTGFVVDDSPDGWLGMLMSGLAGIAAALAIAILLTVYWQTGPRRIRDMVRHGLGAVLALGLFAFVAYDIRHAAQAYLGIIATEPAVEFEIRMPSTAVSAVVDAQVELRTNRNQALARVQDALAPGGEGRSVLRGSVPLGYRTTDRVVVLSLPGHTQYQFKLRLAPSPSRSDEFGPWHLVDRVAAPNNAAAARVEQHDAFAIRYRVL